VPVRIIGSVTVAALCLVLSGCHSLAMLRMSQCVRTDGADLVLRLWIHAPGPVLSSPPRPIHDAVVAVLFYPGDLVVSTVVALQAPFDPDLAIRWGPVGALAGILLPGVTLIPFFYPPFQPADAVLDRRAFDELVTRAQGGDGREAYRDIVLRQHPWPDGEEALHSVELAD
jgi:hypothetical protein